MPVSRIFFYVSPRVPIKQGFLITQNLTFLSKSPVKEPPHHSPPRVLLWEGWPVLRVSGLIIHSYLSESPVTELIQNAGKHHPRSRVRTEGLHTMSAAWCPKGIVYGTAITISVPCSLHHDSFHLGLGRQEPC